MAFKVFIQPISSSSQDTKLIPGDELSNASPNLNIRVKCTSTQEEFRGNAFLNNQYIDKLQRWVNKNKFTCIALNNNTEMELRVQIFKFQLKRVSKSDMETLKQEVCQMKKDNQKLKGELKLFRYYFLHLWRDKYRKDINTHENQEFRHQLVQNSNSLYDTIEANGLILEDFGSKTFYLTFNNEDQLAQYQSMSTSRTPNVIIDNVYSGSTPGSNMIMMNGTPGMTPGGGMFNQTPQQQPNQREGSRNSVDGISNLLGRINDYGAHMNQGNHDDQIISGGGQQQQELEVFLNGGGQGTLQYKSKRASLDFSKMQASGDGAIMLRVNCPISDGQSYQVQIPKRMLCN